MEVQGGDAPVLSSGGELNGSIDSNGLKPQERLLFFQKKKKKKRKKNKDFF